MGQASGDVYLSRPGKPVNQIITVRIIRKDYSELFTAEFESGHVRQAHIDTARVVSLPLLGATWAVIPRRRPETAYWEMCPTLSMRTWKSACNSSTSGCYIIQPRNGKQMYLDIVGAYPLFRSPISSLPSTRAETSLYRASTVTAQAPPMTRSVRRVVPCISRRVRATVD